MVDYAREVRERVGRNVKRLRDGEQWSQDQLAEKVGNTWRHISQIERGQVNVTLDILAKIAEAAAVDVAALFVNDAPSPGDPSGPTMVFIKPDDLAAITAAHAVVTRLTDTARDLHETARTLAQNGSEADSEGQPAPSPDDAD
jgi:transcriptional regulator with XRE-family HTH domain